MEEYEKVLTFWFEETSSKQHYVKDEAFDNEIREKFIGLYNKATQGDLDDWAENPKSLLALIILLDQFSRNLFRNDPRSFAQDSKTVHLVKEAIQHHKDKEVDLDKRAFLYMPLMHSENLYDQELCVQLFEELTKENEEQFKMNLDFAIRHHDIIAQYGRFPHRNEVLGRDSTKAEAEFLEQPGSSF